MVNYQKNSYDISIIRGHTRSHIKKLIILEIPNTTKDKSLGEKKIELLNEVLNQEKGYQLKRYN